MEDDSRLATGGEDVKDKWNSEIPPPQDQHRSQI